VAGGLITDEILEWPPDLFALANVVLERAEAFRFALSPVGEWLPARIPDWARAVEETAREWSVGGVLFILVFAVVLVFVGLDLAAEPSVLGHTDRRRPPTARRSSSPPPKPSGATSAGGWPKRAPRLPSQPG
jgi:hypothetical protein